jgi:hypothetical protein
MEQRPQIFLTLTVAIFLQMVLLLQHDAVTSLAANPID